MQVAPLVGAWIETYFRLQNYYIHLSHPSWVRGLKHNKNNILIRIRKSHPSWVRGLKLISGATQMRLLSRTPRGCVD